MLLANCCCASGMRLTVRRSPMIGCQLKGKSPVSFHAAKSGCSKSQSSGARSGLEKKGPAPLTVTLKVWVVWVPKMPPATQVTKEVPTGKNEPDGGLMLTMPLLPELSGDCAWK